MREENYNLEDELKAFCPFIGFADDPSTRTAFPSMQNVCHKSIPLDTPNLHHQQNFCLNENHTHCPVLWQMKKTALPKNIRAPRPRTGRKKTFNWKAIPVVILLPVLAFAGFRLVSNLQAGPTGQAATETWVMNMMSTAAAAKWTETPTPTVFMTETPNSLEQTVTAFAIQQLSATPTPTATNTPAPVVNNAPQSQSKKPKAPKDTPIPIPP